jgi:uncharacterized protein (DUF934 family)
MGDVQFRLRGDAPSTAPVVSLEAFSGQSNAAAVRIEPGEDARALLPHLDRLSLVEISFPVFTDGRGFSSARVLREAGYTGELRAVGELPVDHLAFLKRCGFDAFAPDKPLDPADAQTAFDRWDDVYQATGDGRQPIWAKRHA